MEGCWNQQATNLYWVGLIWLSGYVIHFPIYVILLGLPHYYQYTTIVILILSYLFIESNRVQRSVLLSKDLFFISLKLAYVKGFVTTCQTWDLLPIKVNIDQHLTHGSWTSKGKQLSGELMWTWSLLAFILSLPQTLYGCPLLTGTT